MRLILALAFLCAFSATLAALVTRNAVPILLACTLWGGFGAALVQYQEDE